MTASAIYDGWVRHRRFEPRPHALRYRMFQPYLDLKELQGLLGPWPLASATRPALVWFRSADHLSAHVADLDAEIRGVVEEHLGERPKGPIRLLTHLRLFGLVFNPVSFFFVLDEADQRVDCVVAEVDNTPWGERHLYVLPRHPKGGDLCFEFDKAFHVSPFMPMHQRYRWRFTEPGTSLVIHMQTLEAGRVVFDATLSLKRSAWSGAALARRVAGAPFSAAQVLGAIYWNALQLWRKRTPVFTHPRAGRAGARRPKRTGFSASVAWGMPASDTSAMRPGGDTSA